jgi:hypothetical protein
MFKPTPEHVQILITMGVIIFGAIVHATAQLKIARETNSEFEFMDFAILTVIASFSGLVFGLFSTFFFDSEVAVILASAIGAFLGMAGLNKIASIFLDLLVARAGSSKEEK